MQWIAWIVLGLLCGLSPQLQAQPEVVRVRIKNNLSQVRLSGLHLRLSGLENKFNKVALASTPQELQISRVSLAGKSYWQITATKEPASRAWISYQEKLLVRGQNLRQEGTALPDQVLLQASKRGPVDVIGVVPLDEYIFSVLASEMPLSWPLETLKAQAVAIRSYTKAVMVAREHQSFHVESSVLDQVYKKVTSSHAPELLAKAREAVTSTAGVYLLSPRGKVLKAFYHSDCGGKTVPAGSVWKQEKDMEAGVAVDPGCPANPQAQWQYSMPKTRFAALAQNFLGEIRSNGFRQLLGFMNLRSTSFEVFDRGEKIEFVGKGFGHGVGLCQWGSRNLGLNKFSYQRILQHYYPLASLKVFEKN